MVGVEEFFQKHRCNELCNGLGLGLGKDDADLDLGQALRTRLLPKKGGLTHGRGEWGTGASAVAAKATKQPVSTKRVEEGKLRRAKRELEESEGKVQRRATMRVVGKSGDDVEEAEDRGRRKTFGVEERLERKGGRARSHNVDGGWRKEDGKRVLLSGIPSLFRLRRKTNG